MRNTQVRFSLAVLFFQAIVATELAFVSAKQHFDDSGLNQPSDRAEANVQPAVKALRFQDRFKTPICLMANGHPIVVERPGYACPTMVDFLGEGVFDLVVGQFTGGKLRHFRNLAVAGQPPMFDEGQWLKTMTGPVQIPGIRCCTSSTPQFVDWDGDGKLDILTGSYASGDAAAGHLFVLFGQSNFKFSQPSLLTGTDLAPLKNSSFNQRDSPEKILLDSLCTHQHAVDFDGDGDLDLIVGATSGAFFYYENIGDEKGKTPLLKQPPVKLNLKSPSSRSAPHLVDWNGNGKLDLITGASDGGVYLSLNQGTRESPEYTEFEVLVLPTKTPKQIWDDEPVPGHSSRVWVFDWNGDGRLDLLVGDCVTLTRPVPGISDDMFRAKEQEFDEKQARVAQAEAAFASSRLKSLPMQEHNRLTKEVMDLRFDVQRLKMLRFQWATEMSVGKVWLYLRKDED